MAPEDTEKEVTPNTSMVSEKKQKEAHRKAVARQNMTLEEKQKEAQRKAAARQNQTPEQREREAQRKVVARQHFTPEQRQQDADRHLPKIPSPTKYAARDANIKPVQSDLGRKDSSCDDCGARHFKNEMNCKGKFAICCNLGNVKLTHLLEYPKELSDFLTETSTEGRNVRKNIRKYNSALAFASFGYQPVKLSRGPPVVVIHGQVYHRTSLSVTPSTKPAYSQLYFLDSDEANRERLSNIHNTECIPSVMERLDKLIREINPFAGAYQMLKEVIEKNENHSASIEMWITKDRMKDPRRYNLPTSNEVAAVFVSEDGEPPFNRDIRVHPKNENETQTLSIISPNCDPMTYPLLFPRGEQGWQPGIPRQNSTRGRRQEVEDDGLFNQNTKYVSMREFYSFHLQTREYFNPLLHAGMLTQQFIVDGFLKVEGTRLEWNKVNQKKLRVELYLGLMDYINSQAEQLHLKPGRMVILPSSFSGGKRAMQQNYQDAMVIVAKFGKPCLFITFTCNPTWKEITEELEPYESAADRPDLVATVFHLKLKEFLHDITYIKGGIFGKVKAYMYVIEFQKRGLPHCHLLLILEDEDKFRQAEEVDSIVCAEIPEETDVELYDIVKTCMMHGPCGETNKHAPCMELQDGVSVCTKRFPKPYSEATDMNVDGYPVYRRRNDKRIVHVRGADLTNASVVPYNPYLLRKYNAHINVEVCSTVHSVKYIFKYIYKGHDAAVIKVNEAGVGESYNWDEIKTYLDTRYISAPEAIWRLRMYEMHSRSHYIDRLPVHLPFQQQVYFEAGDEERQLRAAERKGTKLTKWFDLNKADPEARRLHYFEIPYHYVWRNNDWHERQRGAEKVIARMYACSLKDTERFCLRLLLLHVKGSQSFDEVRTVNGILHPTFKDAAIALNLLQDDHEWEKVMDEAVVFQMPSELRHLFATILIHGEPTNCPTLYDKYKRDMYEDFLGSHSEYMAEQLALKAIEENLIQFGKSCQSFGLPTPKDAYEYGGIDLLEERRMTDELVDMMNAEQRTAYGIIMAAVGGKSRHKSYFLSGAGGCGKTFVYRALIASIQADGGVVKAVAPTGLAATLLRGGTTVHSGFGIPIDLNERTTSRFKQTSPEYQQLLKTKLIIWDEISMCHAHLLQAVNRSLQFLMDSTEPFGGIPIVVGGDFRQQAPVVMHGNRVHIVEASVKSSDLWTKFVELKLTKNMRVREDEAEFHDWLLRIGVGQQEDETDTDFVKIPSNILTRDIVEKVFGKDINTLTPDELASRAILCPKNEDTLRLNEHVLSLLSGEEHSFFSNDSVEADSEEEAMQYPMEFLHSLTPMGLPQHRLKLKIGCCVMLLRNLNPKRGLCNGTRLIVENLRNNIVQCVVFSGDHKGEKVFILRIILDSRGKDTPFVLRRKQFPLRLAYSMTITKSQGQTFDKIGVYLPEPVFTHGQLYTAFSRVRSESGLFLQVKPGSKQGRLFKDDQATYVYNCVYRELL